MSRSRLVRLVGLAFCALFVMALSGCAAPGPTVTPVGGFDMPTAAPTVEQTVAQAPTPAPPPIVTEPTAYPAPPTSAPPPTVVYPVPGEQAATAEPTEAPVEPVAEPTEAPVEPVAEPTEAPVEPTAAPTEPAEYPQPESSMDTPAEIAAPEVYPEPVEQAETAQPAEASADDVALTVLGTPFTMAQLYALEQATAEIDGETFHGVSLLAVLEAAGVDAEFVNVVSRDGYAATIALADVSADGVLAFDDQSTLSLVVPELPKAARVRDVVEIIEGIPADS